jgi:hypothetical protein
LSGREILGDCGRIIGLAVRQKGDGQARVVAPVDDGAAAAIRRQLHVRRTLTGFSLEQAAGGSSYQLCQTRSGENSIRI